ncbi:CapA family protein [Euzebya sp.]|uniref:CapA family protein n=1 Tax=Euzebya sp. TaxID=1971409 RepID=UPI003512AC49
MIDRPTWVLVVVTALVAVVALSGLVLTPSGGDEPVAGAVPTIPDWALAPAVEPDATATPTGPPAPPLTLAFGGDVHAEDPIDGVIADGLNPLEGVAELLSAADLAVVNLETPIATTGTPAEKTYTFRADPALAAALADAGVDLVSLANNHGLDYGIEAADETVDHVEAAGMALIGYGRDAASAYAAHRIDVEGRSVAVVALTRVMPIIEWGAGRERAGLASADDADAAVRAARDAAATADHVVAVVHWGREKWLCPDGDQLRLARLLADAGADAIVGHHPHVLQGITTIDDTLVAFSTGNLVFYARTAATRQSGILTLTLGEGGVVDHTWHPAVIDDLGRPQPVAVQPPVPSEPGLRADGTGPECAPPR